MSMNMSAEKMDALILYFFSTDGDEPPEVGRSGNELTVRVSRNPK
jgi:hypothetical protein